MYRKIKNVFFIASALVFVFLITKHYFSEENIQFINKSKSSYLLILNKNKDNLVTLKNDTNNIIVYKSDLEEFKKKKKKEILGRANI